MKVGDVQRQEAAKPRAVGHRRPGEEVASDGPGPLQSAAEGFWRISPWVLPVGTIPRHFLDRSEDGLHSPRYRCLGAERSSCSESSGI